MNRAVFALGTGASLAAICYAQLQLPGPFMTDPSALVPWSRFAATNSLTGITRSIDEPPAAKISISPAFGLEAEKDNCRRDPSDIIRVGQLYYVWYTKVHNGPGIFQYPSGYSGEIWYATSADGHHWRERALCIAKGAENAWDGHGVFTPGILVAQNKFYLFYTAVPNPMTAETPTGIGIASSDSPDGPWRKLDSNPILRPSADRNRFDSFRVDDACLLIRNGKYWMYYKGRQAGKSPAQTKWGLAGAETPTGPYVRSPENPVTNSGHEVLVWPYRQGVAALIGPTGPEKNTIQYAPDGIHFRVISLVEDPPRAPGGYRPDAFTGSRSAEGLEWGIAMKNGPDPYLIRFECKNLERRK